MARRAKADSLLIWLQIDIESAFSRVVKRDRRKTDDKYADPLDRTTFETIVSGMQNPAQTEDYVVISGKHTFKTQNNTIKKKMQDMGLISTDLTDTNIAKPGMVNLIPTHHGGRVDNSRRNIVIR
jgi:hypothetical protein